jgi:methylthioribulose-1-phosphate dehydratase
MRAGQPAVREPERTMEEEVSLLVEAGRKMGARNWVPATSGNLSVRREGTPTRYLISASGGSKSELTTEDFLLFEVGLRRLDARAAKSSAETAVHDLLYGRYAPGAILHGHPLYATMVAQRFVAAGQVTVTGWELIKAMGFWGEGDVLTLPIVPNHGDIPTLAQAVLAEAVLVTKAVLAEAVLAKAVLAKAVWSQIVTRRAAMAKAALVPAVPRWV